MRTKTTYIKLSLTTFELLKKLADERGIGVSTLATKIVGDYVDAQPRP